MLRTISTSSAGLVLAIATVSLLAGEPIKPTQRRITVDEIQQAEVIGRLGVPLGNVVTIRIRWESDGGAKILDRLIVSELDGARLDPPVVLNDEMPSRQDDRTGKRVDKFLFDRDYLMRAYETARFEGLVHDPSETVDGPEDLVQGRGFHFRSRVVFLRDASGDGGGRSRALPVQK